MKISRLPNGTITSPRGFVAAGVPCGLKVSGNRDLALVYSPHNCTAAGVFTQNQVVAAPVIVSRDTLRANNSHLYSVVINAGNANACTGPAGLAAAREMQRLAADALACSPDRVLVLSTGVIGVPLDLAKVALGIRQAVAQLSAQGGFDAVRAIMTTDTRPKHRAVRVASSAGTFTIGGMVKGSGMIHPNMATMLGVLTTDAQLPAAALQEALSTAVEPSFNRIVVDGDTSTNDAVLLLANGASGVAITGNELLRGFTAALTGLCIELAQSIIRDGEGATRFVELVVSGASSEADALAVARTIATSPLVKTAFAGGDPNWGRILAAAGRAGIALEPARLALHIRAGENSFQLVTGGAPCSVSEAHAAAIFAQPEFQVHLDLGLGDAAVTMWTCDLTHDYVTINADYRT